MRAGTGFYQCAAHISRYVARGFIRHSAYKGSAIFKPSHRHSLLQRAIKKHTRLTREAATGRGIDRHLLGLQLMLRPLNGEHASLFEDELFMRSSRWTLSTSGLSAGHLFRGTGFGAVCHDGYGINCEYFTDLFWATNAK